MQITAKGLHNSKASTIHLAELAGKIVTAMMAKPVSTSANTAPLSMMLDNGLNKVSAIVQAIITTNTMEMVRLGPSWTEMVCKPSWTSFFKSAKSQSQAIAITIEKLSIANENKSLVSMARS